MAIVTPARTEADGSEAQFSEAARPVPGVGSEAQRISMQEVCGGILPPEGKRAKLTSYVDVKAGLLQRMEDAAEAMQQPPGGKERQRIEQDLSRVSGRSARPLVAEPWDKLRGRLVDGWSEYDVTVPANEARLRSQAALSLTQHWAPDCSTFSRALDKPIPGAKEGQGPMAMRSKEFPEGLPWQELKARFKWTAKVVKDKLKLHNMLAGLAAAECLKAARQGRYVIVENPAQSYLWDLPAFRELARLQGMEFITFHNCAFGGQRRKYTAFLTNVPGMREACGIHCTARGDEAPCDFSGRPHKTWAPTWKDGRAVTVTETEAEYPQDLCKAMAGPIAMCPGAAPELAARFPYVFLEVYSGPNAPLTQAVRAAVGAERPRPSEDENGGLPPRS